MQKKIELVVLKVSINTDHDYMFSICIRKKEEEKRNYDREFFFGILLLVAGTVG